MDQLTEILLNIFSLSTKVTEPSTSDAINRPILRLQRADVMFSRLIATLAPASVAHFKHVPQLRAIEVGSHASEVLDFASISELTNAAGAVLHAAAQDTDALQRISQTIKDIMLLDAAIRLNSFADVAIKISHADFFDYIAELQFQSAGTYGHTLVVGRMHQHSITPRKFTNPAILRDIDIEYTKDSSDVYFTFSGAYAIEFKGQGIQRRDRWAQNYRQGLDLRVFLRGKTPHLLQINTSLSQEPQTIAIGGLRLTLPISNHIKLINTSIFSPSHPITPISTYIRAY
jgi:hypothetical protein